jgi:hypothetical protein
VGNWQLLGKCVWTCVFVLLAQGLSEFKCLPYCITPLSLLKPLGRQFIFSPFSSSTLHRLLFHNISILNKILFKTTVQQHHIVYCV